MNWSAIILLGALFLFILILGFLLWRVERQTDAASDKPKEKNASTGTAFGFFGDGGGGLGGGDGGGGGGG